MTPIIGTIASSRRVAANTSFDSIQTVTLTGNQTSIDLNSIPSTYQHLQIRAVVRCDRPSTTEEYPIIRFNSGNQVTSRQVFDTTASSSTVNVTRGFGTGMDFGRIPTPSINSNIFGFWIINIFDYANTSKAKLFQMYSGYLNVTSSPGFTYYQGTVVNSTNAINQISFQTYYGSNYVTNTRFALYGLKAAV